MRRKSRERQTITVLPRVTMPVMRSAATQPPDDPAMRAVTIADSIIAHAPAPTTTGKFPQLWQQTANDLEREYQEQTTLSRETVILMRKTTELMRVGRDVAAENLLNLIEQMEARGQVTVHKA